MLLSLEKMQNHLRTLLSSNYRRKLPTPTSRWIKDTRKIFQWNPRSLTSNSLHKLADIIPRIERTHESHQPCKVKTHLEPWLKPNSSTTHHSPRFCHSLIWPSRRYRQSLCLISSNKCKVNNLVTTRTLSKPKMSINRLNLNHRLTIKCKIQPRHSLRFTRAKFRNSYKTLLNNKNNLSRKHTDKVWVRILRRSQRKPLSNINDASPKTVSRIHLRATIGLPCLTNMPVRSFFD